MLILIFGPLSGAHLNPAVSLAFALRGKLAWPTAAVYMVAQVFVKGLRPHVLRRLLCFSLFWHALDIVWVGVFTMVYLIGAR